jgi:rhodanese-related sulfurtransferase
MMSVRKAMPATVDAVLLKTWLSDKSEIAVIDVREQGQYGEGHPFFAVPLPYSRFEIDLPQLVPNLQVRLVLCDDGDGVAERAAKRAEALGYRNVHILRGGAPAWREAGYTLYAGVNVPSKTFGELVEHESHTPRVSAQDLKAMRDAGENIVIVDGRPFAEYRKMNIPGGICCPNGELVLRIRDIAPDPNTKIVVNCAGRTRSIIGAQTLIDFGVPNPVYALENGTQGWFLAGFELEHGASRRYPDAARSADTATLRTRARAVASARGVGFVSAEQVRAWREDPARTTYLLDVRTQEEHRERPAPGFRHAPGGQLIQATDQWIGVKGARLVLLDNELVRAPVVAGWLRQLGHEAYVLEEGASAAADNIAGRNSGSSTASAARESSRAMTPHELAAALSAGTAQVIDLRASMDFRKGHIPQVIWSIRPRVIAAAERGKTIVLIHDDPLAAKLAAVDLAEAGFHDLRNLTGGFEAWRAAGLPVAVTPDHPPDEECIDFLFFTHGRHDGNAAAARQYLAWETNLLNQLDAQERGVFRVGAT